MRGMRSFGSVPTCSGWGFSTHRAFSSAQDDDTRGRKGSQAGGIADFLKDGIPVSQPSPLGEGAPKGRIGYWRYERQMRKTEKCAAHVWKA